MRRIREHGVGRTLLPGALLIWMIVAFPAVGSAIPRFTLLSGSRCSNCHFNPQGSGLRTELGFWAMNEVGALTLEEVGLGGLASESNTLFGGKLTLGMDLRAQSVRVGRPPASERITFPMQVAAHAAWGSSEEGFNVSGGYNAATIKRSYPGQSAWNAAVAWRPSPTSIGIRAGMVQPSIGIRHDDHTAFVRMEGAEFRTPVVPPDYAEYGGEISYEGQAWLTLNAGAFASQNLQEIDPTVEPGSLSYSARLILWPQLLDHEINGMVGGSALLNGEYSMVNVFAGIGIGGRAMIYGEGMFSNNADDRRLRNFTAITALQLFEWLTLETRYDWGQTERPPSDLFHASAFTLGAQFFPIPYLELRPEYRVYQNDEYRQGQYAIQLHLFF